MEVSASLRLLSLGHTSTKYAAFEAGRLSSWTKLALRSSGVDHRSTSDQDGDGRCGERRGIGVAEQETSEGAPQSGWRRGQTTARVFLNILFGIVGKEWRKTPQGMASGTTLVEWVRPRFRGSDYDGVSV